MNGWAIAYLFWLAIALGICLSKHGEPKTGNYNFWVSLLSAALQVFILWKAGLFN